MAQRHQIIIYYQGRLMTFSELSKQTGISIKVLQRRFFAGISGDRLGAPVRERKRITWAEYSEYASQLDTYDLKPSELILIRHQGELRSLAGWCKKLRLLECVVMGRFTKGVRGSALFRYPNQKNKPARKKWTRKDGTKTLCGYEKAEFNCSVNASVRNNSKLIDNIFK